MVFLLRRVMRQNGFSHARSHARKWFSSCAVSRGAPSATSRPDQGKKYFRHSYSASAGLMHMTVHALIIVKFEARYLHFAATALLLF